ncbi:MAG TPA: FAD-dependent oxidoreductase [Candidatus Saccharimonadales bacterium]|nr:FAD-dependent oxidoreductase [Candidatus Saccharimonadales bacterium]
MQQHDLVIIGAGPASLSAAIYTTREDIDTVLYEKGAIGGLAAITDLIDNYPGFPKGVTGLDLSEDMRLHAERFGADIRLGEVSALKDEGALKRLTTTDGDILAKTVLIATGSDYKRVGVPGEQDYYARGVHYCATCDGAFYRDKKLVVVGGGNSATQESLFLTRFASSIDMLVRGDHLKASEVLVKEVQDNPKIKIHFNTTTDEIVGENSKVTKAIGTDKITGKKVEFPTDGVFVFVGLKPNTEFLVGSGVELNEVGMVKSNDELETNIAGVFVAGDVREDATMQIASAVGEGAKAAMKIREFLEEHKRQYPELKQKTSAEVKATAGQA